MKVAFSTMLAAHVREPTAGSTSLLVACLVGSDMVLDKKPNQTDFNGRVAHFYKFASQSLRMAKKDLPKILTEKLDKAAKDAPKRQAVQTHSLTQTDRCQF